LLASRNGNCREQGKPFRNRLHVAFRVHNLEAVVEDLLSRGLEFDTGVITTPGLKQAFSRREPISGMMFELIERTGEEGFSDQNVQKLFESLEDNDSF
jgi:methylmalonyl-CoA/ethylmalonyl-CoA epimerase